MLSQNFKLKVDKGFEGRIAYITKGASFKSISNIATREISTSTRNVIIMPTTSHEIGSYERLMSFIGPETGVRVFLNR
jgi:hypothetical protein